MLKTIALVLFAVNPIVIRHAVAQPAAIVGPTEAAPGDLVVLDASGAQAEQYRWVLANSAKSILPIEGNAKCVFATGESGRYIFVVVIARVIDGQLDVETAQHTLTVGASPPEPGPGPQPIPPDPTPPQPVPDGYLGLTRFVYDHALADVPASVRNHAAGIGINYSSIASQLAAGTIAGPAEAVSKATELNRTTIGSDREAWVPFFTALANRMKELDDDGIYNNKDNLAAAFRAMADGFAAVPRVQGLTRAKVYRATSAGGLTYKQISLGVYQECGPNGCRIIRMAP